MSEIGVEWTVQDQVGSIVLNRPQTLNALTDDMLQRLQEVLKEAERNPDVRALVLTGQGRGFCSGQDLKALADDPHRDIGAHLDRFYHPLIQRLHTLSKPTIAMVNGVAAGAGMSLAMACDLRIASETARFSQAFVRMGLVPDSGSSYFLPRLAGLARALELAMTGDVIDAHTAYAWGLVNRVVAADALESETYALAKKLAAGPPIALALIKREMRRGAQRNLAEAFEFERESQIYAASTQDHQDAVRAFFAKTSVQFRGR
jgi:2-(1,2-epoxy-1,2-dihydrophenyl)acetyl-CoA isomerase